MNETYDVIVVLVLERETAFRDRVRGEWLAPWGIQEVEALGLRDVVESVPHAKLITRHVGYDETLSAGEAEARAFDFAGIVPSGGCIGLVITNSKSCYSRKRPETAQRSCEE